MADDMTLARAFVALPRWEWRKGMTSVWQQYPEHGGNTIRFLVRDGATLYDDPWFDPGRGRWELVGPDTEDPATLGAILGRVREAWDSPSAYACTHETWSDGALHVVWIAHVKHPAESDWRQFSGPTEAHALYEALKGAP